MAKLKIYLLILALFVITICLLKWEASLNIEVNTFTTDEEVGSDAYYIDSIAFVHPEYSYEMCEDAVFLSDSAFDAKYR